MKSGIWPPVLFVCCELNEQAVESWTKLEADLVAVNEVFADLLDDIATVLSFSMPLMKARENSRRTGIRPESLASTLPRSNRLCQSLKTVTRMSSKSHVRSKASFKKAECFATSSRTINSCPSAETSLCRLSNESAVCREAGNARNEAVGTHLVEVCVFATWSSRLGVRYGTEEAVRYRPRARTSRLDNVHACSKADRYSFVTKAAYLRS